MPKTGLSFMRGFQRRSQDTRGIPPLANPPTCDDIGGAYPRVGHNWQAAPPRIGATEPYQPTIPDDLLRTAELAAVRVVVSIIVLALVIAAVYVGLSIMEAHP